jgi:hypothetical protein
LLVFYVNQTISVRGLFQLIGARSMSKIIISYRRLDSLDIAMRIRDVMATHFGESSVFTDIDSIPLGVDFLDHINSVLSTCDALIAIVGPRWIDAGKGPGQGLHLDTDFVRIEVEAALKTSSVLTAVAS